MRDALRGPGGAYYSMFTIDDDDVLVMAVAVQVRPDGNLSLTSADVVHCPFCGTWLQEPRPFDEPID
jgi:hypothetical protein